MGDVFDLDALAVDTEAEPFRFRFDGLEYELPARPDLRFFAALEKEQLNEAFRYLMGTEQWDRILAADAVFSDAQLRALVEAYLKHVGVDLPE